jgi:hypothetical protein
MIIKNAKILLFELSRYHSAYPNPLLKQLNPPSIKTANNMLLFLLFLP